MTRASLRFRLWTASLAGTLLVLVSYGAVVYHRQSSDLRRLFDETLQMQCEIIATALFENGNRDPAVLSGQMQSLRKTLGSNEPDLYQVTSRAGDTIMKSPGLSAPLPIPDQMYRVDPGHGRSYVVSSFQEPYRVRCVRFVNADGTAPADFFILYGEPSRLFAARQGTLMKYLALLGGAALLAGAVALWILLWIGLRPLTDLSRHLRSLGPGNLQDRLEAEDLPVDLRDIAEALNGLLDRLQSAFERERQFSADAAHELSTPIAVLKANIQSALLASPPTAGEDNRLCELLVDVERLERLADSLLTVAEAESRAGSGVLPCEDIEVVPLLDSLARQFQQDAGQRGISVTVEECDDVVLKADPNTVERVLVNLIDNAIKHGRSGGRVWLSANRCDGDCEIRVADNGHGIPPEDIPRLFERFFRVDKSRSRAIGGAGLGLAIAKTLCEAQGGSLGYETRMEGGNIFIVRLPGVIRPCSD